MVAFSRRRCILKPSIFLPAFLLESSEEFACEVYVYPQSVTACSLFCPRSDSQPD